MTRFSKIPTHSKIVSLNEISEMNDLKTAEHPRLFKVYDMISKEKFVDIFGNNLLYFSCNGNSTVLCGKMTLKENIKIKSNKYIFADIVKSSLFNTMCNIFPQFKGNIRYIISRIYCGSAETGSHFHFHPPALNYLISGTKIWLMIPPTLKNTTFYYKFMEYNSTEIPPLEWLDKYASEIFDNVDGVFLFVQKQGTVVYVPDGYYHFVVNITDVIGITYSWEPIKFII